MAIKQIVISSKMIVSYLIAYLDTDSSAFYRVIRGVLTSDFWLRLKVNCNLTKVSERSLMF